ncbi:MAG: hypothetical protein NTU84_03630 [Verrucomicrobia bacterium]|nr:hypothetical protein [Verrucomicrobiota bacterium]
MQILGGIRQTAASSRDRSILTDEMPGEVVSGMTTHARSGDHRPPDFLHSFFTACWPMDTMPRAR